MPLNSKKGITALALVVLIVIILAIIILIAFITPINSVIINELAHIGKSIGLVQNGTQTGGGGNGSNNELLFQSVNFTLFNCSTPTSCSRFSNSTLLLYVNYNGQNLSNNATKNITFPYVHPGQYIYKTYNFTSGNAFYYANLSLAKLSAGETYGIYYFFSSFFTVFKRSVVPYNSSGYWWSVTYNGITEQAKGQAPISFNNPFSSGSVPGYTFSVQTLSNTTGQCTTTFTPSPASGFANVGSTVSITFSPSTVCTTMFTESGLPTGYTWNITYDGVTKVSSGISISFTGSSGGPFIYSVPLQMNSTSGYCRLESAYVPNQTSSSVTAGHNTPVPFFASTGCRIGYSPETEPWSVEAINTSNNTAFPASISASYPLNAVMSPNGKVLYMINHAGDEVTVVNTSSYSAITNIVFPYPIGAASGLTTSADGRFVYIDVNGPKGNLSVIDTSTYKIIKNITVGAGTDGVAVTPNGMSVYVANYGDNTVSVVDTSTFSTIATIPVGIEPEGIAITPNGKLAYVADYGAKAVSVINTSSNKVLYTVTSLGGNPEGIAITPNGKLAYVSISGSVIVVINTTTNSIITTIGTSGAGVIAITPDGKFVYTITLGGSAFSVINTSSNQVISTFGSVPFGGDIGDLAINTKESI